MRNITRTQEPESLRKNAKNWTKELLNAIKKVKRTNGSVPNKYYNQYRKDDIREALQRMYGDGTFTFCCYCESIIDDVSFNHIEHRKPKKKSLDKYPEETYNWHNLHLACGKCNGYKREQYNESEEILDAVLDRPIEEHLSYELAEAGLGVYRIGLSERGNTTIRHPKLNRLSLRMARLRIYNRTIKAIKQIKTHADKPQTKAKSQILYDMCEKEEHGTLIMHLLHEWGIERAN